jgi:hypothetical protein
MTRESGLMDEFVASRSTWRTVALIAEAFGFVAAGLWITGLFDEVPMTLRYSPAFTVVAGWFCAAFFGFCALAGIKSLFGPTELLRVGRDGLRWMPWSDQIIPWNEVSDVTTWGFKGQRSIVLKLHNPDRFPARSKVPTKAMWASRKLNQAMCGGHLSFSLAGADHTTEQALSAIRRFRYNVS